MERQRLAGIYLIAGKMPALLILNFQDTLKL